MAVVHISRTSPRQITVSGESGTVSGQRGDQRHASCSRRHFEPPGRSRSVRRVPELSKQGCQQLNQDRCVYRSVMKRVARCCCCWCWRLCMRVASMLTIWLSIHRQQRDFVTTSTSAALHATADISSSALCLFITLLSVHLSLPLLAL